MNWMDLLLALPRGLKTAASAVASPFKSNGTPAYAANDPAGEMSAGGGKGTLSELLKILGSVGKTTGRVGNQVGRMLPVVGPYYQGAEYGVLKGLGKEDSDWAGGNMFAEAEKRREEQEAEREHSAWSRLVDKEKFGQEREKFGWEKDEQPLRRKGLEQGVELGGLQIGNENARQEQLQIELEKIRAQKQAVLNKYGSLDSYEGKKLEDEEAEIEKRLELLGAQTQSYKSLSGYRDTRASGGTTLKDTSLMRDRAYGNALQKTKAEIPEQIRFTPEGRKTWADTFKRNFDEELSALNLGGGTPSPNADPNNTLVWFRSMMEDALKMPEHQGKTPAQIAQILFDSIEADGMVSAMTPSELELLKSVYGVVSTDSVPGVK